MPVMPPQEATRRANQAPGGAPTRGGAVPPARTSGGAPPLAASATTTTDAVAAAMAIGAASPAAQGPKAFDPTKASDSYTFIVGALNQEKANVNTLTGQYQAATKAYNDLAGNPDTDPQGAAMQAAANAVEVTGKALQQSQANATYWYTELYKLVQTTNPALSPADKAMMEAQIVQSGMDAQKVALDWSLYSRYAPGQAEMDNQSKSIAMQEDYLQHARNEWQFGQEQQDQAFNRSLEPYKLEVAQLQPKVIQSTIDVNTANAAHTAAGTTSIDIANQLQKELLEGGIGAITLRQSEAAAALGEEQVKSEGARRAGLEEDNRGKAIANDQAAAGPSATYLHQLGGAIADPANPMNAETAADDYFNAMYGGNQFTRKQEANRQASGMLDTMTTAGALVNPDQQYVVGGEPGGVYQQGLGALGLDFAPTQLHPLSAGRLAALAGIDIDPRQGLPSMSPFLEDGTANPAFQSPLLAHGAPPPSYAANAARSGTVIGNMTPNQYKARFGGGNG